MRTVRSCTVPSTIFPRRSFGSCPEKTAMPDCIQGEVLGLCGCEMGPWTFSWPDVFARSYRYRFESPPVGHSASEHPIFYVETTTAIKEVKIWGFRTGMDVPKPALYSNRWLWQIYQHAHLRSLSQLCRHTKESRRTSIGRILSHEKHLINLHRHLSAVYISTFPKSRGSSVRNGGRPDWYRLRPA